MPIMQCTKDGKIGFKWGENGTCFTYTPGNEESQREAIRKANAQAAAIRAGQAEAGGESSR